MKLIIIISYVLAMALLSPCQGIGVTQTNPDEPEIKKDMKIDMGLEMGLEIMQEIMFGSMNNNPIKEPAGVELVIIIEGYHSNPADAMTDDKGDDKHVIGSVTEHNKLNKTATDNEHEERTTGATETALVDKVIKEDDKEVSISMLDEEEIAYQKELNDAIADEEELAKEIIVEMELDLEEANDEEIYEEMLSEEIKEILQFEDNESKGVTEPKVVAHGIISDDEDDEHEGSGIEEQNKTTGIDSELFKEVENEIAMEEDYEEIIEEIESMKIEGMDSEIKELQQEEDNILEEIDILENTVIEKNEVPAVHSANHATRDNEEQQLYSQSTMRLVFFVSAGILMLSVLLLLIMMIVTLTKKETTHGKPATRYAKRIRLVSNASTESKQFLV